MGQANAGLKPELYVLFYLYLIQGIPYGFQSRFLPIYLRTQGLSLTMVGAFKLLYLPWIAKTLYAPLVDNWSTKQRWLQASIIGLLSTCLVLAFNSPIRMDVLIMCLFLLNLCAATQDIAVDGVAVEYMSSKDLGAVNVAQVVGYKVGAVVGGGVLITLSGVLSWTVLFLILVGTYFLGLLLVSCHSLFDRRKAAHVNVVNDVDSKKSGKHFGGYFRVLKQAAQSPETMWTMGLVFIYKLGEQGALNMLPLYMVDRQVGLTEVGFWTGVVGQITSVLGSAYGGWVVKNNRSTVTTLTILCAIRLPLMLCLTALMSSYFDRLSSTTIFYLCVALMNIMLLLSGVVTTVTFTLMMECSQLAPRGVQATRYTALSTAEVAGKLLFGSMAGLITDGLGYSKSYVVFTALSALTVIYLIFANRYLRMCRSS